MNCITLVGNLVADPEMRMTVNGKAMTNIRIAVNRTFKKQGEADADYFRIVCFGRKAEVCNEYLSKGKKISVVGSVKVDSYRNADDVRIPTFDVFANDIQFLSPINENNQQQAVKPEVVEDNQGLQFPSDVENTEDVPF